MQTRFAGDIPLADDVTFDENTITLEAIVQMFKSASAPQTVTLHVETERGGSAIISAIVLDLSPINPLSNTTVCQVLRCTPSTLVELYHGQYYIVMHDS